VSIKLLDPTQSRGTFRIETVTGTKYRIRCLSSTQVLASGGSLGSESSCELVYGKIWVDEPLVLLETKAIDKRLGLRRIETSNVVKITPCP
jgi:hypothetical protein